jgi:hypothetical protein
MPSVDAGGAKSSRADVGNTLNKDGSILSSIGKGSQGHSPKTWIDSKKKVNINKEKIRKSMPWMKDNASHHSVIKEDGLDAGGSF